MTPEQVIYAANQEGLLEQHPPGLDTAVIVDHNAPSLADMLHATEEKAAPTGEAWWGKRWGQEWTTWKQTWANWQSTWWSSWQPEQRASDQPRESWKYMGYETYADWRTKQQRYKEKIANLRRDSHRAMCETLLRWLALQDQRKVAARERTEKAKQDRIEKEHQERFVAAAASAAASSRGLRPR